jgi:hypothetical protein
MPLALPLIGVRAQHGCELLDTCEQALTGDGVCHTKPSSLVRVYQEAPKPLGLLSLPNAPAQRRGQNRPHRRQGRRAVTRRCPPVRCSGWFGSPLVSTPFLPSKRQEHDPVQ